MSNLVRCANGHTFSTRRHGTICPYCNEETARREKLARPEEDDGLLAEPYIEPVCGWLVCIEGAQQGKSYNIHSGKNFLGRADDMDIQILGDNKVDRRNHAVLVYDPKKRSTVLLPGDSQGLVYHGDEAVYQPTQLTAYDKIEIGNTICLFVPFCGEHCEWGEHAEAAKG